MILPILLRRAIYLGIFFFCLGIFFWISSCLLYCLLQCFSASLLLFLFLLFLLFFAFLLFCFPCFSLLFCFFAFLAFLLFFAFLLFLLFFAFLAFFLAEGISVFLEHGTDARGFSRGDATCIAIWCSTAPQHLAIASFMFTRCLLCIRCASYYHMHVRMGIVTLLWGEALRPPPNPPSRFVLLI